MSKLTINNKTFPVEVYGSSCGKIVVVVCESEENYNFLKELCSKENKHTFDAVYEINSTKTIWKNCTIGSVCENDYQFIINIESCEKMIDK